MYSQYKTLALRDIGIGQTCHTEAWDIQDIENTDEEQELGPASKQNEHKEPEVTVDPEVEENDEKPGTSRKGMGG